MVANAYLATHKRNGWLVIQNGRKIRQDTNKLK